MSEPRPTRADSERQMEASPIGGRFYRSYKESMDLIVLYRRKICSLNRNRPASEYASKTRAAEVVKFAKFCEAIAQRDQAYDEEYTARFGCTRKPYEEDMERLRAGPSPVPIASPQKVDG